MMNVEERIRSLNLSTLFRWFILYSMIGWIFETIFCFSVSGNLTKRGFLFGPICPIYGLSLLVMIIICSDMGKSIIGLIIKCGLVSSVLEYFTSTWMEQLFDKRWWDYSDMIMNINGRICLGAFLLFGILGALIIRFVHPSLVSLFNRIPDRVIRAIDRTVVAVFLYDILLSFRANIG